MLSNFLLASAAGLTAIVAVAVGVSPSTTQPESNIRPAPESRAADEFVVDPAHSSLVFRVQHMSAGPFWGRFNEISGKLKIDAEDLESSFVEITVPATSVDTNNESRDKHLRSPDFFATKEFTEITFRSSKIEAAGDDRYRITGELTLHGTSKEITVDAVHTGTADINERFGLRTGYEVDFEIDRTEFGMTYGVDGGALGKTVRVIIGIEGQLGG